MNSNNNEKSEIVDTTKIIENLSLNEECNIIGDKKKWIKHCSKCGKIINYISKNSYRRSTTKNCKSCSAHKLTPIEFIDKANLIHKSKYDYSNIKSVINRQKIEIKCPHHGYFFQRVDIHLSGHGCPKCGKETQRFLFADTKDEFIKKANSIHKNRYDYSIINYINGRNKIEIICKEHGPFIQRPDKHLDEQGCPRCTTMISSPEKLFLNYLKISDNDKNRQKRIKQYKVDGIIGIKIFEFLGDYWHGNPKVFPFNSYNKIAKKTFEELYNKTIKKFGILTNMGYKVYYIWENDWKLWNKNKNLSFPLKKFNVKVLI